MQDDTAVTASILMGWSNTAAGPDGAVNVDPAVWEEGDPLVSKSGAVLRGSRTLSTASWANRVWVEIKKHLLDGSSRNGVSGVRHVFSQLASVLASAMKEGRADSELHSMQLARGYAVLMSLLTRDIDQCARSLPLRLFSFVVPRTVNEPVKSVRRVWNDPLKLLPGARNGKRMAVDEQCFRRAVFNSHKRDTNQKFQPMSRELDAALERSAPRSTSRPDRHAVPLPVEILDSRQLQLRSMLVTVDVSSVHAQKWRIGASEAYEGAAGLEVGSGPDLGLSPGIVAPATEWTAPMQSIAPV